MNISTQLTKNAELGDGDGNNVSRDLTLAEIQNNFRIPWKELDNVLTLASLARSAADLTQIYKALAGGGYEAVSSTPYSFVAGCMEKRLFVTTGASPFDVNLPAASTVPGAQYTIHKADSGAGVVRVNPNGSDVLKNGQDTVWVHLRAQYQSVTIMAQSGIWVVIGGNYPQPLKWLSSAAVGSGLLISTVGTPTLAWMTNSDVAFYDSTNTQLRCYRFQNGAWSLVGSGLTVPGASSAGAIAAISATDVAFTEITTGELRCYRFNGSTWSLVGSGLAIATMGTPALAALNATDVAFIDSTNDQLRCYRFNGSTWSLVGSGLSLGPIGVSKMAALDSSHVAYIDNNGILKTYFFNGSVWVTVGSGLTISGYSAGNISAINGSDIFMADSGNSRLRMYRFNGSTWSQVGYETGLSMGVPAVAAMNGAEVAFIDANTDTLTTYRFAYSIDNPYHP